MAIPIFDVSPTHLKKIRAARGKVWGSDDINVEGWKTLKRLPGHESGSSLGNNCNRNLFILQTDVTDLAWSPGDRYLASVGLDSAVMIWCGFTLGPSSVPQHHSELTFA